LSGSFAHDISEGGIICALAECCIINYEEPIGAEVNIPFNNREDYALFSESQSRVIVSVGSERQKEFEDFLKEQDQVFQFLGKTGGQNLKVNDKINLPVEKLINLYYNSIPSIMNV